jgi:hypothetical protein
MPRCLVRWRLLMIKLLAFLLYICTDITNMHEKPFPNVFLTILLFEFFFFSFLFFGFHMPLQHGLFIRYSPLVKDS